MGKKSKSTTAKVVVPQPEEFTEEVCPDICVSGVSYFGCVPVVPFVQGPSGLAMRRQCIKLRVDACSMAQLFTFKCRPTGATL